MKKTVFLILFVPIAITILTACGMETEILKEETYTVENLEFVNPINPFDFQSKMTIETDQEQLVVQLRDARFIKTNEEISTIHAEWKNEPLSGREDFIEAVVYVTKSDVKKISKAYAEQYNTTLNFEIEEEK